MEILSPAGNYKAFIGAVNAGADAVYLGGTKFGARAYADNFTDEEIIRAIQYAHVFGVKVYLTVNTLLKESEFEECIEYITPFYEAGLDACIVQDIGLISVFGKYFPKMECHVSTQGFSTGIESVKYYRKMGASRVVLARELSLSEIVNIKKNVDVELETFIHGAMCYSYSGECLFSSCIGGRSGNRGRCAGTCRLPYRFSDNNKKPGEECYLLSMKDQCTIEMIPELIKAGIDSLKIEGRMKKPEYTAFVTSIYRKYIDMYINRPDDFKVSQQDIDSLKHMYLRSEIGTGYYHKYNGKDMITLDNPAYSGNDEKLMQFIKSKYLDKPVKKPVDIYFAAVKATPLTLTLVCDDKSVTVSGEYPEIAENNPTTREQVLNKLSKLNDTPFELQNEYIDIEDGLFIPAKFINELRRDAVNELIGEFLCKEQNTRPKEVPYVRIKHPFEAKPIFEFKFLNQLQILAKSDIDFYALMSTELLLSDNVNVCAFLTQNNIDALVALPFVARDKDTSVIYECLRVAAANSCIKGVVVNNTQCLNILHNIEFNKSVIIGPGLYCFNNCSVKYLIGYGDAYIYPYELSKHDINDINEAKGFLFTYGRVPVMHSANCVLKTAKNCMKNIDNLTDCGLHFNYIKDRTGSLNPIYRNCMFCNNTIYNSVKTVLYDEIKPSHLKYSYLSFTDENPDEILRILKEFSMAYRGNLTKTSLKEYTKAYYKHGVE